MINVKDDSYLYRYIQPSGKVSFPRKINIHCPLRGALYHYCVALNSSLSETTSSDIDFSAKSFQIPHITLFSAFVIDMRKLQEVMNIVFELSFHTQRIKIVLGRPYIKNDNWIFVDAVPSDEIFNLKYEIARRIDHLVVPMKWDVAGEPPHVTVGYIRSQNDLVCQWCGNQDGSPSGFVDAIEISYAGVRGSCIGTMRTFELNLI